MKLASCDMLGHNTKTPGAEQPEMIPSLYSVFLHTDETIKTRVSLLYTLF